VCVCVCVCVHTHLNIHHDGSGIVDILPVDVYVSSAYLHWKKTFLVLEILNIVSVQPLQHFLPLVWSGHQ